MFTGIITDVGEVVAVESVVIGASISHSGVCLTVVETGKLGNRTAVSVDAAAETLRLTTASDWKAGTRVNLERALKVGDELGGHIVAGHVDGVAELVSREDLPDMARLTLRAPKQLMRFVATKGSVALDGISLTVNEVTDQTFSVLIIPHTLSVTTLGSAKAGGKMNLEIDLMARYAARLMETR